MIYVLCMLYNVYYHEGLPVRYAMHNIYALHVCTSMTSYYMHIQYTNYSFSHNFCEFSSEF